MTELDKAARAAMEANIEPSFWTKLRAEWDEAPKWVRIIVTIVGLAGLMTASFWEGNNSGGGWRFLGKGVAAPQLAWISGFGFTVLYFVFHRLASESLRNTGTVSHPKTAKRFGAAAIFAALSVIGVFANLVQNAEVNKNTMGELAQKRGDLLAQERQLTTKINSFDEIQMNAALQADRRALDAYIAEAAGWGMADLDPTGACLDDLKPRQRQLCNEANGPDGLRASIDMTAAAIQSHAHAKEALETVRYAIKLLPDGGAAAFWDGVSEVLPGQAVVNEGSGSKTLVWTMLVVSLLTIFGTGFGWDGFFEAVEEKKGG